MQNFQHVGDQTAPRLSKPLLTHHFNHYSTDKTIFSSSEKERVRKSQQPSSERCIDHYEDSSVHRALAVELRDHRADPISTNGLSEPHRL